MGLLNLVAQLSLNASTYEAGLKRVQSTTRHVGEEIGSELKGKLAAAFSGAAIEEAFRRTMEYAHKLKDLNLRTGLSTDELQAWDFAAERTGTTIEEMVSAMERLGIAQAKAIGPEGANSFQALTRLGLSSEEIHNLDGMGENLKKIFETVRSSGTSGQVLKDLRESLGRSSMVLIPLMREGLEEATRRLDDLNGRLKPEQIDQMTEATNRFKAVWVSLRPIIGGFYSDFSRFSQDMIRLMQVVAAGAKAFTGEKPKSIFGDPFFLPRAAKMAFEAMQEKQHEFDEEKAREKAAKFLQQDLERLNKAQPEAPQAKPDLAEILASPIALRSHAEHLRGNFDSLARIGGLGQTADFGTALRSPLHEIARYTRETANHTQRFLEFH